MHAIKNKSTNILSNKMLNELRTKIFNKVLSLKLKDFEKFPSSDVYTRLTVDAENVKTLFSDNIPVVINDLMHIIFMIIVMIMIDIKLSIIGITIIIILAIYSFGTVKKLKKIQSITVKKRDLESREFSETYSKSKLTKFFALEDKNISKVNNLMDEELKNRYKYIFANSFLWPVSVLAEAVSIYAILYYVLNVESGISLGTVYIFLYYIRQCFSPLKELFNQLEEIQNAQVSLDRINTILLVEENEDIKTGLNVENLKGDIELENVTFSYDKQIILDDISFKMNAGEKTAIIGRTRSR